MVAEEPNYNGLMVIKTIKTIEKNNFINLFHQKKVYPLINIEQNYGRSMVSPWELAKLVCSRLIFHIFGSVCWRITI